MDEIKERIAKGDTLFGTMISEVAAPNVVRIMKAAGYDFAILDCEHGYFDFSQIASIAAVGKGFGISVIVRIPAIEREFITKVLDMGCDGILAPMVSTAEAASEIVSYSKYAPLGKRGISTTRPHTEYAPPPLKEYVQATNKRTSVWVQIETKEGVRNVEQIAAVEGIDALMVGPNDLAMEYGEPGVLDTECMNTAIAAVLAAAMASGKPSGIISSNLPILQRWRRAGMRIFSCSSETGMILKAAKELRTSFWNES